MQGILDFYCEIILHVQLDLSQLFTVYSILLTFSINQLTELISKAH